MINCDLSRAEDAEALAGKVVAATGRIDILVNNARAGKRTGFDEESPENWATTLAVGLQSAFFASRGAIKAMPDDRTGAIVNIGSILSETISNESPSYHVAKGGLDQLTRYLAVQGARKGVRVNAVAPGFIVQSQHRERFEGSGNSAYREIAEFAHPLSRVGTEGDVARAVRFLASSDASFITGECLRVDGGVNLRETSATLFDFAERSERRGDQ
jgi:3-oxoacyl-[acyl-carrier protein] reductase